MFGQATRRVVLDRWRGQGRGRKGGRGTRIWGEGAQSKANETGGRGGASSLGRKREDHRDVRRPGFGT